VLLTGHAGDAASGLLAGAADAGPFTLLRKPVAPAELADAAQAMLAAAD
jgi:CheY-like chemotaxis protein